MQPKLQGIIKPSCSKPSGNTASYILLGLIVMYLRGTASAAASDGLDLVY
jgi:hypothetical protein